MHDVHTCFSENKKAPWTANSAGDDAYPSTERLIYHSYKKLAIHYIIHTIST